MTGQRALSPSRYSMRDILPLVFAGVLLGTAVAWNGWVVLGVAVGLALVVAGSTVVSRDARNVVPLVLWCIAFWPSFTFPFGVGVARLADLAMLVFLAFGAAIAWALAGRGSIRIHTPSKILWLMFLSVGVSLVWQTFVRQTPLIFRDLFEFYRLPLFLLAFNLTAQCPWPDRNIFRQVVVPLTSIGCVQVVICVVQHLSYQMPVITKVSKWFANDPTNPPIPWIRAQGTMPTIAAAGQLMLICFAITTAVAVLAPMKTRTRLLLALAAGAQAGSLVLILSRSAIIGLAVTVPLLALLFILLQDHRVALGRTVMLLLVLLLVGSALVSIKPADLDAWIVRPLLRPTQDLSWRCRFRYWPRQAAVVAESPLFGGGPSKFELGQGVLFSDNSYLLILRSYGLVGLSLWLCLLGAMLLKAARVAWTRRGTHSGAYAVGIIGAVVASMVMAMGTDAFAGFKVMALLFACVGVLCGIDAAADTRRVHQGLSAVGPCEREVASSR